MSLARRMLSIWRQVSRHSPPTTTLHKSLSLSHTLPPRSTHITPQIYKSGAMVIALGPGKFYGSSLPRPRFFTDVKLNDERVDPPLPVMGAFMSWAEEAHWSMGGLSFTRHRLQGRIEGNVEKLRAQRETAFKNSPKQHRSAKVSAEKDRIASQVSKSPSPPPAPVAIKRRRVVGLLDEDEEELVAKRGPVRKLGDDFERVARESGMAVDKGRGSGEMAPSRTRSKSDKANEEERINKGKRKLVKAGKKIGATVVAAAAGIRSSPRLAKLR